MVIKPTSSSITVHNVFVQNLVRTSVGSDPYTLKNYQHHTQHFGLSVTRIESYEASAGFSISSTTGAVPLMTLTDATHNFIVDTSSSAPYYVAERSNYYHSVDMAHGYLSSWNPEEALQLPDASKNLILQIWRFQSLSAMGDTTTSSYQGMGANPTVLLNVIVEEH
jgi:hypothetical protein